MAANKVTRLVYKREDGKWAWHLKVGRNIIATDGGAGYENLSECREMADYICSGYYWTTDLECKIRRRPSDGS